jgi:hypothetical protein
MGQALAMTDSQLIQAMRAEIHKNTTTVKSPKLIFHWVDASDIMPQGQFNSSLPADDARFKAYVDKQGRKLYNARRAGDRDIAGPGLYMATDPIVSRQYGGERSFGLIVGLIDTKARLLPSYYSLNFSPAILAEVRKRGCQSADTYLELLDTYDAACNKLKQLLVEKDITLVDGRLYSWSTQTMPGCSDSIPSRDVVIPAGRKEEFSYLDTFVVYHSRFFSEIFGFTHKSTSIGKDLPDSILSYLKGLQAMGAHDNMVSAEQLKDLRIKAMTPQQVKAFSQKYIMGCIP